ncbi:(2,3-dihydroxybenzoyl)adenylate synthase [Actinokineospora cianjurensis]|uniref:2,3-dihydroxybenzoate-AMP ligase/mycobactin salicyl-AMP ligase n=1 Tax=Actinokineospora cianjurensis TaxID=585224 RepID=A0A421AW01_9PSEU|nr:(2,3-dihydroxybenzoyl)adenylate synthase [Actinokineospora cianjurensis]RLK53920.1 2,3-dihydroxybenzoate-AMP ligase/mycobactin salicyl-AMP ligase [Actinokineospora cianjurensis]
MSVLIDGAVGWPEELAAVYRERGYWRGDTLGELLRSWAERSGDDIAVVSGDERVSYRELDRRADVLAAGLLDLGIARDDRVVVQLPNVPEFVVLLFALARIGAVPVMALPAHRRAEISHLVELSGAVGYVIPDVFQGFDHRTLAAELDVKHVLVVGDPGEHAALSAITGEPRELPPIDPAAVAVLLISGGTTGRPKLIPRTHDDYAYNARASAEVCELTKADRYLVALPVAHNFPLACPGVLGILGVGGVAVMAAAPSPDVAFPLIQREGVTVSALVPPMARMWVEATEWSTEDLSTLRLLQVGGAKMDPDLARAVPPALGCAVQQVFGMAEGLLNYTRAEDSADLVENTQGRPLSPDDEIRVVDAEGQDVIPGEIGELLTRGPYTLRGYYRAEQYNATAFTPDGFYRSGDLVRQLPSGHLVVEGRIKDVINRGGEKVPAGELEDLLLAHPGVAQAAAIGLPDDTLGELVCAVIVAAGTPPKLKALRAHLAELGLARYKQPDRLVVLDELPLTAVGKISKRDLVARLGA